MLSLSEDEVGQAHQTEDEQREISRLIDEVEQLRTALESSADEVNRLAEDRDRLLRRLTTQARELQAANSAYSEASSDQRRKIEVEASDHLRAAAEQEELRVAFEEMQVLTEELEVANDSLHETNKALDRRVEERTRELEVKNAELTASELRFRTLAQGIPQLVWRAVDEGKWTWASPQWTEYTGQSDADSHGLGWLSPLHPDDRAEAMEHWSYAVERGRFEADYRVHRASDGSYRWFQTRAVPARDEAGEIVEWLGTSTDVDDLHQLQERQQVLVAELQHRTRNLLGVVRSVADRTVGSSISLADFAPRFRERLGALSRINGLLSKLEQGERVTFDEMIRNELSTRGWLEADTADRVRLDGPPGVRLRSSTVQTFALAIHELTTNAVKYGALSDGTGRLCVRWWVGPDEERGFDRLHVEWVETQVANMPEPNEAPRGGGYGRELIERALPYSLGARTTYELRNDGLRCTIDLPLQTKSNRR